MMGLEYEPKQSGLRAKLSITSSPSHTHTLTCTICTHSHTEQSVWDILSHVIKYPLAISILCLCHIPHWGLPEGFLNHYHKINIYSYFSSLLL